MFEAVDVVVTEVEVSQLLQPREALDASDTVTLQRQLLQLLAVVQALASSGQFILHSTT